MNDNFPYVYEQGHWISTNDPAERMTLHNAIKTILCFILIAAIAFVFAWGFVCAWDKQHDLDQAKTKSRIEDMLYDQADTHPRPAGRKLPTWGNDGPQYSTGHEFYRAMAERGR